ncbi:MAG: 50S ribosomal protein L4 [Planctomycetota bacterium]
MDVPVYNMQGSEVGKVSIDELALGETVNPSLIKQAYVRYHANLRQGSARSKGRSEIQGTSKKMYRQKGSGNARHGDKKPPQFRGGGHYKSDRRTREDFRQDMPKKMRRKANRNALLAKLIDNEVKIVDKIDVAEPKTKAIVDLMGALNVDRSALLALSPDAERSKNARLSARNVDEVTLCRADQLTCFEMLNNRYLVIEKDELEAWLSGASSQTDKSAKIDPKGRERAGASGRERAARPKRGAAVKKELRDKKLAAAGGNAQKGEG